MVSVLSGYATSDGEDRDTVSQADADRGSVFAIKAWVIRQRRKLFDARAEVRVDGELVAESDAVLYAVPSVGQRNEGV